MATLKKQLNIRTHFRYSTSFKLHVISEIESGKLSIGSAKKKYDIRGAETIQTWLSKFGKNHLLPKVVRVERPDEIDRIKKLEQEKQQLESALATAHVRIVALESLVDVAEEHYDADFKKNFGSKQSKKD